MAQVAEQNQALAGDALHTYSQVNEEISDSVRVHANSSAQGCEAARNHTQATAAYERPRAVSVAWGTAGLVAFALGAVGVVLPFIPTTPFMILAAFCFARSSRRLDAWFRSTKLYHSVLENYVSKRTMTVQAKAKILIPVTILLAIAFAMMGSTMVGRVVVALVWTAHIVYFGFIVKTEKEGA